MTTSIIDKHPSVTPNSLQALEKHRSPGRPKGSVNRYMHVTKSLISKNLFKVISNPRTFENINEAINQGDIDVSRDAVKTAIDFTRERKGITIDNRSVTVTTTKQASASPEAESKLNDLIFGRT